MKALWICIESICFILGALFVFLAFYPAVTPSSGGEAVVGFIVIALGVYIAYAHRDKNTAPSDYRHE